MLKTRALTEQVYVDEVEVDEEGIAEILMDDTSNAQISRKKCFINDDTFIIVFFYHYCLFSKHNFKRRELILIRTTCLEIKIFFNSLLY